MARGPKKMVELPRVAIASEIAKEDLPAPVVYYPNHYGTFFAFADSHEGKPALCACAESAVHNLLRLRAAKNEGTANPPWSAQFPKAISEAALRHVADPLAVIRFRPGLCHRCNLKTPTLRYCHEMYGQRFVQSYGWYINQNYLRLGILPMGYGFIPDVCPPEYQVRILNLQAAHEKYQVEYDRLTSMASGPRRLDILPDEPTYWRNVRDDEAQKMIELRRLAAHLEREVTNGIQNITRAEFGLRAVGEGWVSETLLYQIVCRLFSGEPVLRHHRPDWLEGLELDIYLPEIRIALEYQGQQHFHPIKAWGGEKALLHLQERDARKARTCAQVGVRLVTIDYTEPLTDEYIRERLAGLTAPDVIASDDR